MRIPSYQIHKVLEAFRQQLQQAPGQAPDGNPDGSEHPNRKFQSVMEKIAAEIVEKITHSGPPEETHPTATPQSAAAVTGSSPHPGSSAGHFDFNFIDSDNTKRPRSISLKDKPFL